MLTFSRFGSGNMGNLGNQLFQYAACIGLAKKYQTELLMPPWKYSTYFKEAPILLQPGARIMFNHRLQEPVFKYCPQFWDKYEQKFRNENVDVNGWLQSEKYFDMCTKEVREALTFSDALMERCRQKAGKAFGKPVIAISIRRGDYVNNPNYFLLPISYYLTALTEHFPKWRTENNLFIFSDDMPYARHHFGCLDNAFFADGFNDIEQLCTMSMAGHYIIANSTFSWWGAWLGEKKDTKIIRPNYHFGPGLLSTHDWSDFYPTRWKAWDHRDESGHDKTMPLKDVTFTIPVFFDHPDRKQNIDLSIASIIKYFDTNIIVGEQYTARPQFEYFGQYFDYRKYQDQGLFHRTKILNDLALAAKTPIIVNWDTDNIVAPMQLMEAANKIRAGREMVFPYNGQCARVPREWYNRLLKELDTAIFTGHHFSGMNQGDERSVGQAIFFHKQSFLDGGMENEFMISYAPEDRERYARFNALGYAIDYVGGPLYHLDHFKGDNSSMGHPKFSDNQKEYEKVKAMNRADLIKYIKTWPWISDLSEYKTDFNKIAAKVKKNISTKEEPATMPAPVVTGEVSPPVKTGKMFAVIVPYRDRPEHLQEFLRAMHSRKMPCPFDIYIIEQKDPILPFNRAKLLNIGFLQALTKEDYDYFVFHDVDMIPVNADYSYPEKPTHIASQCSQFDYKMPYPDYFGGVTLFNRADYEAVNGHSNEYVGWGKEDDDIFVRLHRMKMPIERRPCRFECLKHAPINLTREAMDHNAKLLQEARYGPDDIYKSNGLSNCVYNVVGTRVFAECTIITVDI